MNLRMFNCLFDITTNRGDDITTGRDNAVTCLKGFGILLMILGHCTALNSLIHNSIYSFHMPLFFICSGLFYKSEPTKKLFKKLFQKLVVPYIVFGILTIILCFICDGENVAYRRIQGFIYGNGSPLKYDLFNLDLGLIGPIWFLMALFWCRLTYNFIAMKTNHVFSISILLSVIAVVIGRNIVALPFSILEGFSAMIFYAIGVQIKTFRRISLSKFGWILAILTILFCCFFSSLRMSEFWYTFYPVDIVGAIVGTYSLYKFSSYLCLNSKGMAQIVCWFGNNSLMILCMHQLLLNIQNQFPYAIANGWIAISYNFILSTVIVFFAKKLVKR